MNTCAHPHCETEIEDYQLACRPHWYELPTPLRNRIWRYYANDNKVAHAKAIRDAFAHWAGPPPPDKGMRCQHCRQPTDFRDPETGRGQCITCTKARLTNGPNPQAFRCHRCSRTVDITVSIDDGAELCLDCQYLALLEHEGTSV